MVSVIIPAYNVADCIDDCVRSIVNQTMREIEIILLNDGSTDDGVTERACLKWAESDERVIYIKKKNERLGPTRNMGVRIARYDYIMFVDADDWIAEDAVEKMYQKATACQADIVSADYYFATISETGISYQRQKHWIFEEGRVSVSENKELIYRMNYSMWAKLFKKSLFVENNIEQPAFDYEDSAVLHYMIARAKFVAHVKEGLYFYRVNRAGKITNNFYFTKSMQMCLDMIVKEFKNAMLFDTYRKQLRRLLLDLVRMSISQASKMRGQASEAEYQQLRQDLLDKLFAQFPETERLLKFDFVAIGSISLRNILKYLEFDINRSDNYVCFSSIVSMFDRPIIAKNIQHPNHFRKQWIEYDLGKKVREFLEHWDKEKYLFIDFLEERFDICVSADGSMFTYSDAYQDIESACGKPVRIIHRNSDEMKSLWRSSCDQLIELLNRSVRKDHVMLVRLKLAEKYGEYGQDQYFTNIEEIKKMNLILEEYYNYFVENYRDVRVLDFTVSPNYFTDVEFRYECAPYHLNDCIYMDEAEKIMETIFAN